MYEIIHEFNFNEFMYKFRVMKNIHDCEITAEFMKVNSYMISFVNSCLHGSDFFTELVMLNNLLNSILKSILSYEMILASG